MVLSRTSRQRGLAAGARADLIEFRYDAGAKSLHVERTVVGGEVVWSAR
jgi:hypothetical protein